MDIEEIRTLTNLMVDNDLSEIMIRDGETRILLRRKGAVVETVMPLAPSAAPAVLPAPAPPAVPHAPAPPEAAAPTDDGLKTIKSPMVGSFYGSPDPESSPFVKIGDRVAPDTVVCIIEAMKVFNEIKAEVSGTIESIVVESGAAVEFGQVLMKVRPG